MQSLKPIDDIKVQVHKNTDAMSHLQAAVEEIKTESKQAAMEIAEISCLLKELKKDLSKGKTTTHFAKSTIHGLKKKLLGKTHK